MYVCRELLTKKGAEPSGSAPRLSERYQPLGRDHLLEGVVLQLHQRRSVVRPPPRRVQHDRGDVREREDVLRVRLADSEGQHHVVRHHRRQVLELRDVGQSPVDQLVQPAEEYEHALQFVDAVELTDRRRDEISLQKFADDHFEIERADDVIRRAQFVESAADHLLRVGQLGASVSEVGFVRLFELHEVDAVAGNHGEGRREGHRDGGEIGAGNADTGNVVMVHVNLFDCGLNVYRGTFPGLTPVLLGQDREQYYNFLKKQGDTEGLAKTFKYIKKLV